MAADHNGHMVYCAPSPELAKHWKHWLESHSWYGLCLHFSMLCCHGYAEDPNVLPPTQGVLTPVSKAQVFRIRIGHLNTSMYDNMKYQNYSNIFCLECCTSFCFCCVNWLHFSSEACNFLWRSPVSSWNFCTSAVRAATTFSESLIFWVRSVK